MIIKYLEKLNSYYVCSDCEPGLKIELVKILKKSKTKPSATLLDILVHFDITHALEFERTHAVICIQLSYGQKFQ